MLALYFWIGIGVVAGGFTAQQLTRQRDMSGLFLFTIAVGVVGALAGGFGATFFGVGELGAFNLYNMLCALGGASAALIAYCLMTSQKTTSGRKWSNEN